MERRTFVSVVPAAKKNKLGPIFSKNIRVMYILSVKKQKTGQKTGKNPPKKGVFISTSDHLSNFWRQQLLRPATFRASNFWGQQLLRSATFRANNFFPAFCRNHKALVIVLTGISWGLQILYCLMEFSTSAVGSIACKSTINAICNQCHLLVSI